MPTANTILEFTNRATGLLADFQQTTLYEEGLREPAIRGFIIVGCFVVLPVVVAWFFERCSGAWDRRHGISDD